MVHLNDLSFRWWRVHPNHHLRIWRSMTREKWIDYWSTVNQGLGNRDHRGAPTSTTGGPCFPGKVDNCSPVLNTFLCFSVPNIFHKQIQLNRGSSSAVLNKWIYICHYIANPNNAASYFREIPQNYQQILPQTGSHFFHDLLGPGGPLWCLAWQNKASWWLNQPIWKICSSKWESSPSVGVNMKNIWNHHLVTVSVIYSILA